MSEIGPNILGAVSEEQLRKLGDSVVAFTTAHYQRWPDIYVEEVTVEDLRVLSGHLDPRTVNAIARHLSANSGLSSISALMKIRNFGAKSLLDYLTAAERFSNELELSALANKRSVQTLENKHREFRAPAKIDQIGFMPILKFLALLSALPSRSRWVVSRRGLNGSAYTLQEVGDALGLSRERVRQIEDSTWRKVRGSLGRQDATVLQRSFDRLQAALSDKAYPLQSLEANFRVALEVPEGASLDKEILGYATSLLGFRDGGDGYAYRGAKDLLWKEVELRLSVGFAAQLRTSYIAGIACDLHVPVPLVETIAASMTLRQIDGVLLPWTGNLADKAERILLDARRPLDFETLCGRLASDEPSPNTLKNYLLEDPRFTRVGRSAFALSSWGLESYSNIRDAIRRRIRAAGGRVLLSKLLEELPRQFGVAESSVRTYASSVGFRTDDLGFVYEAMHSGQFVEADPAKNQFLFKCGARWFLKVVVNADVERGSGRVIPNAAACELGLQPGQTADRVVSGIPVRFSWHGAQPTIGSVRRIVKKHRCLVNDLLFIELTNANELATSFFITNPATVANSLHRLCAHCGIAPPYTNDRDCMTLIGSALGLPTRLSNPDTIRLALNERRDFEAAQLVPERSKTTGVLPAMTQLLRELDR